jgi:prolipoprotein diacylglyceryltransferase
MSNPLRRVNALLDGLPRPRVGALSREVPTFRTCGIVGYYLALITLFAGGLLTGRSLLVLAVVAVACGISFFAYAHLRRAVMGQEVIVLLEHVWFAQLCVAAVVRGLGESLPPYLDLMSPPLALFLASGRVGCLMVGCCHGRPSSLGIVYGPSAVRDGFAPELEGVRLFPVALIEALGLVLIALLGLAALPWAAPGRVFLWWLLSYSIMRFGLEGLRGDRRPHLLRLSQARWMSLAEFSLALYLAQRWSGQTLGSREAGIGLLLAALLAGCLTLGWASDPRRRLLSAAHVSEVRALALDTSAVGDDGACRARSTSAGVSVVVTPLPVADGPGRHVSLFFPDRWPAPRWLCELAAEAFPDLGHDSARLTARGVLHLVLTPGAPGPQPPRLPAESLYGAVARRRQLELEGPAERSDAESAPAASAVAVADRFGYFRGSPTSLPWQS